VPRLSPKEQALILAWLRGFDDGYLLNGQHISNPFIVQEYAAAWDAGHTRGRIRRMELEGCSGALGRDAKGEVRTLYPPVGLRQAHEAAIAERAAVEAKLRGGARA
jgi:hypothetical protein